MSSPNYSDRPDDKPGCKCVQWNKVNQKDHGVSQSTVDSMFLGGKAPSHDNCARPPLNNSNSEKGSWCYCDEGGSKMCDSRGSKITTLENKNGRQQKYYHTNDGMYLEISGAPPCLKGAGTQICPTGQERGYGQVVSEQDSGAVVFGEEYVCPDTSCVSNDGTCSKHVPPQAYEKKEQGLLGIFNCSYLKNNCDTSRCEMIQVGNNVRFVPEDCTQRSSSATCKGSCEFKNNQCQTKPKLDQKQKGELIQFPKKDGYVVSSSHDLIGGSTKRQIGNYQYNVGNRNSASAQECRDKGFTQYGQYCAEPILRCVTSGNTYVAQGVTPNFSDYTKKGYKSVYQCVDGHGNNIKGLYQNADSDVAKDPIPNILFTAKGKSGKKHLFCLTPPTTNTGTVALENYSSHEFIKDVSFFTSHVPDFYWYSKSEGSGASETFTVIPKHGLAGIQTAIKIPPSVRVPNIWFVDGNYIDPKMILESPTQKITDSLFDFQTSKKGAWIIRNDKNQTINGATLNLEFMTASGDQYMDQGKMNVIQFESSSDHNHDILQVCGTHKDYVFAVQTVDPNLGWAPQDLQIYSGGIFMSSKAKPPYNFKILPLLTHHFVFPNNIRLNNERARVIASDGKFLFVRAHRAVYNYLLSNQSNQSNNPYNIHWRSDYSVLNSSYASIFIVDPTKPNQVNLISSNQDDTFRDFDVAGDYIYAYDKSNTPKTIGGKVNQSPQGDGILYRAQTPTQIGGQVVFQKVELLDPSVGRFFDPGLQTGDAPANGYTKQIERISIDWQAFQMGAEPLFNPGAEMLANFERLQNNKKYSYRTLSKKYKYGPKYLLDSLGSILSKNILQKNNEIHPLKPTNTRQKALTDTTDYASKDLEVITPAHKNAIFENSTNFMSMSKKILPKACFLIVPKILQINNIPSDIYDAGNYQIYFKYGFEKICLDDKSATLSFWPPNEHTKSDLRNTVLNIISPRLQQWAGMSSGYIAFGEEMGRNTSLHIDSIYKNLVYFVDPGFKFGSVSFGDILANPIIGRLVLSPPDTWKDHFVELSVFFSLITVSGASLDQVSRLELPKDAPSQMYMYREQTGATDGSGAGDMSPIQYNNIIYDTASKALENIDKQRHGSLKFDVQTKLTQRSEQTKNTRKQIVYFLDKTINENDDNIKKLDHKIYNTQRLAGEANETSDRKDALLFILKCSLNYCIIVAIIFVLKLMFKETFVSKYIHHIIIIFTILFIVIVALNLYSIRNRSNRRWKLRNWSPGKSVDVVHSASCDGEIENVYRDGTKSIPMKKDEDKEDEVDPRSVYCTPEDKEMSEKKYQKKINQDIKRVKQNIAKYKREMERVKRHEKKLEAQEKENKEKIKELKKSE